MSTDLEQKILDYMMEHSAALAGLTAEVRGINARLDKLNGKTARHETEIAGLKQARENEQKTKEERQERSASARDTWKTVAAIGGVVVALTALILK